MSSSLAPIQKPMREWKATDLPLHPEEAYRVRARVAGVVVGLAGATTVGKQLKSMIFKSVGWR